MDRREFINVATAAAALAAISDLARAAGPGYDEAEIEAKVREVVAALDLDEKLGLMVGVPRSAEEEVSSLTRPAQFHGYTGLTTGAPRLGVPPIRCLDGPRGVGFHYIATCFPAGVARGAAFDPELEERIGEAMGYETWALGANMLLAPCINLLWHPRWGRAQETYGEDPYHLGAMGAAFVRGVQRHAIACPKHYAVNNLEDLRTKMDAIVDERLLREIFLPHFKACVEAGAASIMSSYNYLNGSKAGQNHRVNREILKDEWGFDGFVVSDWGGAMDDAVEAAGAGLDLEMPVAKIYGPKLRAAVDAGEVPLEAIDDAVARMVRQTLRFSGPRFETGYDETEIGGSRHAAIAREAAAKGVVLLKNEGPVLPFALDGIKRLAVLGKRAAADNLGDHGSSRVTPPSSVSILAGIQAKVGDRIEVSSCGGFLPRAAMLARRADAVVVVVGLDFHDEGEGHDRKTLKLSAGEIALIETAVRANKNCAVILIGGSAITMEGWLEPVPALLMAWYPGMEGGHALADVLFGDVNPSGKLPIVFPRREDQLPKFQDRSLRVEYTGRHGYRWLEAEGLEPEFHFGYGLSYTRFEYSGLRLASKTLGPDGTLVAQVEVTNAGEVAGEEVAQLYVGFAGSGVDRPVKELKAFTRVALEPGQTKTARLEVPVADLAYYDLGSGSWKLEAIGYQALVGGSSRPTDLMAEGFRVSGG